MKTLIVYDSFFGNTEAVAEVVAAAVAPFGSAMTKKAGEAEPEMLEGIDLLVVGSPTRAFRPTPAVTGWLKGLSSDALRNVRVAAFDTRISVVDINSRVLAFLVSRLGYAAEPIAKVLRKKGGTPIASPEGFFVVDKEGPLKDGERDRAERWASALVE